MGADGLQVFLAHLSSYLRSGFWEAIAYMRVGCTRSQTSKIKHVFLSLL
ncbi:hypothetical protein [Nostoc sp.]